MIVDNKQDFADLWINLQAETRLMHNYLLQNRFSDAADCAGKCKKISGQLIDWCENELSNQKAVA
jgi:hypothetical protein